MHRTDAMPDLIETIYDAALQPSRWSDVVAKINKFIGSQACGVFSKDSVSKYGVTRLVYVETYSSPSEAIAREKALKEWRRDWKIRLMSRTIRIGATSCCSMSTSTATRGLDSVRHIRPAGRVSSPG